MRNKSIAVMSPRSEVEFTPRCPAPSDPDRYSGVILAG